MLITPSGDPICFTTLAGDEAKLYEADPSMGNDLSILVVGDKYWIYLNNDQYIRIARSGPKHMASEFAALMAELQQERDLKSLERGTDDKSIWDAIK
ncbi:hypothetical protein AUK40_03070 [Candidatus Wirthbacteria bacterium CG2_30_54_11]|uniref:Uncharacterized protein n=1 Tax=Candidatus Wirthbacteria bacterium CG2_30_54_11 TaxID=1817892 RepID=A0A1J5IKE0_9BACT|nr:MAG: hypothetical protein AUK40_03070 [Candidatus Wirthbacteria bacterium CG2_30_54_11]